MRIVCLEKLHRLYCTSQNSCGRSFIMKFLKQLVLLLSCARRTCPDLMLSTLSVLTAIVAHVQTAIEKQRLNQKFVIWLDLDPNRSSSALKIHNGHLMADNSRKKLFLALPFTFRCALI